MGSTSVSLLMQLRKEYHRALQDRVWGWDGPYASNADKGSKVSSNIAAAILRNAHNATNVPAKRQTAGVAFTEITMKFVKRAFSRLTHLRPGTWQYSTAQTKTGIMAFEQYRHLATIRETLEEHRENRDFRAAFATDYLIVPDIVVAREPVSDTVINTDERYVSDRSTLAGLLLLDEVGGPLAYHDGRAVGAGGYDIGHDGRIDHPEPLQPVDSTVLVDHRRRVRCRSHLARA